VREMVVNSGGMGDVLNPTAGTALDCGLFAGGVFSKACWCLSFPSLCSSETYQAAYALAHPEVYTPIPPAPGLPAVSGAYSSTPESTAQYDAEVAQAWDQWKLQADTQNQAAIDQTAANLEAVAAGQPSFWSSIPTWAWVALGFGVFALVAAGGGSPGRYGR
jgi:hypothetical protein